MRYAVYFTPPADDPLTLAASAWLGRNAFTGQTFSPEPVPELTSERLVELTADPRRYGFHATLKAPFALAEGQSQADLEAALAAFCKTTRSFAIPNAVIGQLGAFFAIVPAEVYPQLQDFAASVVETFEPFRAPLSDADIARRKPERLTPEQHENLMRWGYPYAFDTFRFHMTLTGQVPVAEQPAMGDILHRRFATFTGRPLKIGGLGLYVETARGEPFSVHSWLPLAGA
ncbi:DUF1045 domain-containing protein [Rhizobium halophytocola]|uniref:Phosphonate metabolism protein n=1 Tax=Rhizobium halophytocola TaxID=735519 RepID=A0ABS4E168_9HYPH|nr:DUF1045 domain-containing protein [Rhizobium halophytocola]MBP1851692.1 putative phosphonate metabolism protein [Rhizobium halophytocola]